jgi:ferredoxin
MPRNFEVVEEDCIGCGLCSERAPENLEIPAGTSTAQVFKQPRTSEEEQACLDARDYCPMGGIQASAAHSSTADASAGGTRSRPLRLETPRRSVIPATTTPAMSLEA